MELGIHSPQQRRNVWYCLIGGHVFVTLPALLIIGAGFIVFIFPIAAAAGESGTRDISTILVLMGATLVPPAIGWLWWSYAVPQWRIWALRTVDNWPKLEGRAIMTGLIWPRGTVLEKTEIKSPSQKALEVALLHARDSEG